jgi:serine/threonine-protein kinase
MADKGIVALQIGAVFHERYHVVRSLKAGGMGAVYEVVDERTNSPRALKIMLPGVLADPDLRARFALEAKVTGNIASDHIVRISDAAIDDATGTPFLVMELLQGEELGRMLARRGPLSPDEVALYLHQAALALDKTHAAGIVHRDLKPDNLFVTYRDDGSPCVKILDFGIAKVVAESTARTTHAVGTPIYMALEQVRGEPSIGPRADLFALGHIAYTLLTGEGYWNEEAKATASVFPLLTKIAGGMVEDPSARALRRRGVTLPPAFDAWMRTAVASNQEDRFDRATTQIAALAEALGIPPSGAALPPPSSARRAPLTGPAAPGLAPSAALPTPGAALPAPSVTRPSAAAPAHSSASSSSSGGLGSGGPRVSAEPAQITAATQSAMVSGTSPPRARSLLPAALGAIALGALSAVGLFAARSRTERAGASSAVATEAPRPAEPPRAGEPTPAVAALRPSAVAAPPSAASGASVSPPTASVTAPAKAPPSGRGVPRRATPPKPSEDSTPPPTRITTPL